MRTAAIDYNIKNGSIGGKTRVLAGTTDVNLAQVDSDAILKKIVLFTFAKYLECSPGKVFSRGFIIIIHFIL